MDLAFLLLDLTDAMLDWEIPHPTAVSTKDQVRVTDGEGRTVRDRDEDTSRVTKRKRDEESEIETISFRDTVGCLDLRRSVGR